ncbi:TonB-dependent receptor [Psychrosphaera ytuae]|uniref:TonB-dependent receptor n=1 Tax=Psychrosphaera ytuae TaxID=2820710 RepID=A0A975HIZ0_9GAMM|nr:TonB-dependent receptor [Psychrosphaera ytuae]QTH64770.1 TonB-dependent receptor [Psychrosphaera ytuae]
MKYFKSSVAALAVATTLGAAMPALANNTNGFIGGSTVTANGQDLAGVSVTVTNLETGLTRTVVSEADGDFRFPLLPPGKYSVVAKKDGFDIARNDLVNVSIGGRTNLDLALQKSGLEVIEVRGGSIAMIDTTSSESSLVVGQELIERVPVPRNVTGVALLAPGTTKGDSTFGNLASFGGASVAENAYYLNGLNITNFRNGLGGSNVPFEFYDTFEVKTGGYSAEFGRSTGGVVNATTKSGSNEFKAGANFFWEPDSLRAHHDDVLRDDGSIYDVYHANKSDEFDFNVYASGALIKDKLFYFVLLNPSSTENESAGLSTFNEDTVDSTFWGAKIDYYLTDEHLFELTAFSDERTTERKQYNYNANNRTIISDRGEAEYRRGGDNLSLKYTGIITDDFTISALYGINKFDRTSVPATADAPFLITDLDTGENLGSWVVGSPNRADDQRTVFRIDADYYVGDHTIRFGIDREELEANEASGYSGGNWFRYQNDRERVRVRVYENEGSFKTESNAFYIQDTWAVNDNLTLSLGLRNESFENFNVEGKAFVEIDNQWAPRIGAAYDVNADGTSKVFANFGRYFLPIATNTNLRMAGAEFFTQQYCDVVSIDENDAPTIDNCGGITYYADGEVANTGQTVNKDLDPMYQDEFILGYEFEVNDEWTAGVKATYRTLGSSIEDIAIDYGFDLALGGDGTGSVCTECSGFHYYVLTNPGTSDVTIDTDPDGDGPLAFGEYTIPNSLMGYPEAEREYKALEFSADRAWDDVWSLSVNYVWSKSEGNNEGFVRSDNGQDDAGITTNFDQPGLTDGAYGPLPNDRRHSVKIFGAYAATDSLRFGANLIWQSGRAKNAFGFHPTDVFASYYEAESFAQNGQIVPRGSLGNLSSTWNLDVSATYDLKVSDLDVVLRADIFNVFNNDTVTDINETAEQFGGYGDQDQYLGVPFRDFGQIDGRQAPRSVRFSASVKF